MTVMTSRMRKLVRDDKGVSVLELALVLPLLTLMLWVAASGVRPALRSLWGVGILVVFVHCLVDYPMQQRPALAAFFFSMLGMAVGAGSPRGGFSDEK